MRKDNRVSNMLCRAYDMYPLKHEACDEVEDPFPMYSFERAATEFWCIFIESLMDDGATDSEVEWILRSKHMRWMFDNPGEEYESVVRSMAKISYINAARDSMEDK